MHPSSKCTRLPRRRTAACTSARRPTDSIYQVAADGTSKTFFDPDDKYIWALAVDKSGNVFAATGDKGVIYKITPDGKGTRFYKTNAGNVVSLAFNEESAISSPAPNRRAASFESTAPGRRSCCSIRRSARSTPCVWPTTARSTRSR